MLRMKGSKQFNIFKMCLRNLYFVLSFAPMHKYFACLEPNGDPFLALLLTTLIFFSDQLLLFNRLENIILVKMINNNVCDKNTIPGT